MSQPRLRFGLVASRLHRTGADCGLQRWLAHCAPTVRELNMALHAVGPVADVLSAHPVLAGDPACIVRYPSGRHGGLVRLVSHVVTEPGATPAPIDGVIYLIDPVDPTTLYPEAQALKRQCVIHGKPFISTTAGALEWMNVERMHAGLAVHGWPQRPLAEQVLALIAHDALKNDMVAFATRHFDLLSRYGERLATGTTGGRLNELAWSLGWPASQPWVQRFRSGPLGGDAQIAERVLDHRCDKVIFFEDPHVARQHEADIQLMERAVCVVSDHTTCANSPTMAERWAQALSQVPPN